MSINNNFECLKTSLFNANTTFDGQLNRINNYLSFHDNLISKFSLIAAKKSSVVK